MKRDSSQASSARGSSGSHLSLSRFGCGVPKLLGLRMHSFRLSMVQRYKILGLGSGLI